MAFLCVMTEIACSQNGTGWPTYGGDAGGQRYSAADQITLHNVSQLRTVWSYRTRALEGRREGVKKASFEATPVLLGRMLLLSTPFDEVIALDATSGHERWRYDPRLPAGLDATIYTSRGVAVWLGHAKQGACAQRVFLGTLDARLIALDATDGQPCVDFGVSGAVDLKRGLATQAKHPYAGYGVTSPPTVVGDVVVVGSTVADNQAADVEPGVVRGFDARTGQLRWTWDPLAGQPEGRVRVGGTNTWGVMAADVEHGLVYLPTGSAAPDFYGGERPGANRDADSVVALEAGTGRRVWAFQTVHHDLWDYDVASQPLLFTLRGSIPAIAITTKTGMIFVLNRLTGEPLSPVQERPAPASDIPGERASASQPVSTLPSLAPLRFEPRPAGEGTPKGDRECAAMMKGLRYDGMFTPPSEQGSLLFPGSLGGVNWGSAAFDPGTGMLYADTNRMPFAVQLMTRQAELRMEIEHNPPLYYGAGSAAVLGGLMCLLRRRRRTGVGVFLLGAAVLGGGVFMEFHPIPGTAEKVHFGAELSEQRGTPFWIFRRPLVDSEGRPCVAAPWGAITAINLDTGLKIFERPLGTMNAGQETGTVGLGGPVVTGGGLVFTAASREPLLRAFDKTDGAEVWQGRLPVPAQSTPMVYSLDGREYVVVCAGGHGSFGTETGDTVLAFALPQ